MGEGELRCVCSWRDDKKKKQHCSITALLSSPALHLSRCHPNKAREAPSARGSESRAEQGGQRREAVTGDKAAQGGGGGGGKEGEGK